MRRKVLFLFPGGVALLAFIIGLGVTNYTAERLRDAGLRPDQVSEFWSYEAGRWLAVSVAVLMLAGLVGATMSIRRWQGPIATFLKAIVIVAAGLAATQAAYWPDRELMSRGMWIHPPGLAIILPLVLGLDSVVAYRLLLDSARGSHAAGA